MKQRLRHAIVLAALLPAGAMAQTMPDPAGAGQTAGAPVTIFERMKALEAGPERVFAAACCKVCSKGKACGNSCINRSYSCSKPPGCACDR